jgi:hypothetical protein
MFGTLPAYGMYVRHVRGLSINHVDLGLMNHDARPPIMIYDAADVQFEHVRVQAAANVPVIMLNKVSDFSTEKFSGLKDMHRETIENETLLGTDIPVPGATYTPAAPAKNVAPSANTPIPR